MSALSINFRFWSVVPAAALFLVAFLATGCEQSTESFREIRNAQATNPNAPSEQTADLINRLQRAKEMDLGQAHRADVSAVGWEDDMIQAGKADKAAKELSHGIEVSRSELDDALFVPPASLSGSERARLINQVQQAIRADQHQEDTVTASATMGGSRYPTRSMAVLENHKQMAEGVLKDLEVGEDVHWQTLNQATQAARPQD
jgi:hypothetical protein